MKKLKNQLVGKYVSFQKTQNSEKENSLISSYEDQRKEKSRILSELTETLNSLEKEKESKENEKKYRNQNALTQTPC